jgi:hypothetical protein
MALVEIGDPKKALRALDRLMVNDQGLQLPSDDIVYGWKRRLREQIMQAILNEPVKEEANEHPERKLETDS